MKQVVTVNGVTLTRQQVEAALDELNAPDPLKGGDVVWCRNYPEHDWIVLGDDDQARLRSAARLRSVREVSGGDLFAVRVCDGLIGVLHRNEWKRRDP